MRQHLAEERALDRADYLTDKDSDFANTSPAWSSTPQTDQGARRNVPGIEDIPEGTSCTINGWPGKWKRVNGTMTCIPNNKRADALDCYELYDLQIADQWRGPSTAVVDHTPVVDAGAWHGPNLEKELAQEEEEEDDETDDDEIDEIVRQVSTHTESSPPQRFDAQDRLQREHRQRLENLRPQFRKWDAERRQIDSLQRHREQAVDAEIARYEERLRNAYKEGK
jgi:hypothetical protein